MECTEQTDEKFVEGRVFLVATRNSPGGLIEFGDFSDPEKDTYLASFKHNGNNYKLGETVYSKVKLCCSSSMPEAYEVTIELQEDLYKGFKSEYKTHNAFEHGLSSGAHTLKHIWVGSIDDVNNTISFGTPDGSGSFRADGGPYSVSVDLINKANQILGTANSKQVYINLVQNKLLDVDTCHYHNGVSHGCI